MTVHHHDPDLVMALAAGTLPAADLRAAAAAVAGCDQCTADLESQRTALGALASLDGDPAARLTDLEARRLLRNLHTELDLPAVAPAAKPRRQWSWGPVAAVAAVLLGVVIAGNALRSMTGGDDADTAEDLVASGELDDSSTGDVGRAAATTASPEAVTESADGNDTFAAQSASPTTSSPAAEAGAPEATALPLTIGSLTVADLAGVWSGVTGTRTGAGGTGSDDAPDVATELVTALDAELAVGIAEDSQTRQEATDDACIGAAALFVDAPADVVVVGLVDVVERGPTVLTVSVVVDGTARLLLHDPTTCVVVDEVPSEPAHP